MAHEPGMTVAVNIDGQKYPIRYSLRTLKTLQKEHGIALLKGAAGDLSDPEKLALVLYHGLREHTPSLTLEWVEDHVDASTLVSMIPALTQAISGRSADTSPNAPGPSAVSGTGSLSGPRDGTTSTWVNGPSGG